MKEEKKEEPKNNNSFAKNPSKPMGPSSDRSGSGRMTKKFKRPRREGGAKSEFGQKIVSVRRVARVMAGGRRFSFSVALVIGDRKGSVGVGLGKAGDTPLAIEKAFRSAQKNMIKIPLTKDLTIPHEVRGKVCSSIVFMAPAPGRGILAGSSVRDVVELAGIKNINAKLFSGSKNKLNNAKAAVKALSQLTRYQTAVGRTGIN